MRAVICILLCFMLTAVSGCGSNRETANPAPETTKKQTDTNLTVSDNKAKAETVEDRPSEEVLKPRRFSAVERIPERVKANFFYGDKITSSYLSAKSSAVATADGYKQLAWYFDDGSAVYQSEKKYVEECFAQGIKLRLVYSHYFKDPERGRSLENRANYSVYEMKIYMEYSYEYTFVDKPQGDEERAKSVHGA